MIRSKGEAGTGNVVEATTHFRDAEILARVSAGLGEPMVGISTQTLDPSELLETRGW
jgi:pyridoxal 5'-phosphate synthase pdxS subunit